MRFRLSAAVGLLVLLALAAFTSAQETKPAPAATTRPAGSTAEEMLNQMLAPNADGTRPIPPAPSGAGDATTGESAVAPGAPSITVMREGSLIVDRTGRFVRSDDGQQWEFHFDADGRALRDPPVVVLPNLTMMAMENYVTGTSRNLRFRITGEVTEYRGRNYVLLRKAVVMPEVVQQF
jgi:hypothetical protein